MLTSSVICNFISFFVTRKCQKIQKTNKKEENLYTFWTTRIISTLGTPDRQLLEQLLLQKYFDKENSLISNILPASIEIPGVFRWYHSLQIANLWAVAGKMCFRRKQSRMRLYLYFFSNANLDKYSYLPIKTDGLLMSFNCMFLKRCK